MLARMAAVITAGLTGLTGAAAMACELGPCAYTPASPAYAVAPPVEHRDARRPEMNIYRSDRAAPGLPVPAYRAQGWSHNRGFGPPAGFESRPHEDDRMAGHPSPDRYDDRADDRRDGDRERRGHVMEGERQGGPGDAESYDYRFGGRGYAGRAWGYSHGETRATGYERHAHGAEFARSKGCEVCAAPPAPPPVRYEQRGFEAEGVEAPEMAESFFYGGLSGGAGPGVEIGGPGGFGYGNGSGAGGFGAAQAWGEGMASAYASAHASASAYAFASGGVHGCSSCWARPKPPPHKPGCGCKHR